MSKSQQSQTDRRMRRSQPSMLACAPFRGGEGGPRPAAASYKGAGPPFLLLLGYPRTAKRQKSAHRPERCLRWEAADLPATLASAVPPLNLQHRVRCPGEETAKGNRDSPVWAHRRWRPASTGACLSTAPPPPSTRVRSREHRHFC